MPLFYYCFVKLQLVQVNDIASVPLLYRQVVQLNPSEILSSNDMNDQKRVANENKEAGENNHANSEEPYMGKSHGSQP